jgi:hypothetical protein
MSESMGETPVIGAAADAAAAAAAAADAAPGGGGTVPTAPDNTVAYDDDDAEARDRRAYDEFMVEQALAKRDIVNE